MLRAAIATLLLVATTNCATMFKSDRQTVYFRGGPEKGITKVQTPDGTFEIQDGSGSYLMTRSKSDIPLRVTCPDGSQKTGVVETRFDWLVGGFLNVLNYGLGWVVDPFNGSSYDIADISLMEYCKHGVVAH
jgi:hypothetical protein